jgi:hypothetical protein
MDPNTYTAEHRSFQWELMLLFEDGSLPAAQFTEATLGVVAGWYASNLSPAEATSRFTTHYQRNRHRLTHRLGASAIDPATLEAMDAAWEPVLQRALAAAPPRG